MNASRSSGGSGRYSVLPTTFPPSPARWSRHHTFTPTATRAKCPDALPAGQHRSAFVGTPVTVKIDADGRSGGCQFLRRLRRLRHF